MLFFELSRYLAELEKTTSRNEITKILAEVFKKAEPDEIDKTCYLLLGKLLPSYRGIEFNIAEKIMARALAQAFGKDPKEITKIYKSRGDLGDVSHELAVQNRRRAENLRVSEVYDLMLRIAEDSGEGSQERKVKKLGEILSRLDPLSAKYVTRIPLGKMRLGFSDATILDALSLMEKGDKSARPTIERAFNVTADIGEIARRVKKSGLAGLKKLEAKPGIPIRPSLAERVKSIEEVIEKAGPRVGIEPKLDGFRTQIHVWPRSTTSAVQTPRQDKKASAEVDLRGKKDQKEVALFSRNLENTTAMFPEIVEAAKKLKTSGVILDGETIGYNPKTGKFATFQETVQRKRKHDIAAFAKKIPLSIFIFDILYLNGKSLLELSFKERRQILEKFLGKSPHGSIRLSRQQITDSPEIIAKELKKSLGEGLEGLVAKKLDAAYQAGSRGFHWIKLKATSAMLEKLRGSSERRDKLPDTIDCIIMGAYKGKGKRTKFGVGGLLLGIKGENDKYYSISRLGTGLSDENFKEAHKRIGKLKVPEIPKEYVADKEITPDIWIKPSLVAEILADEITLSPRHTAGRPNASGRASPQNTGAGRKKEGGRGYSLRFPRLVRFRDDKNPEDATSIKEIETMYKKQEK